jgi:hypothetical protein
VAGAQRRADAKRRPGRVRASGRRRRWTRAVVTTIHRARRSRRRRPPCATSNRPGT